MLRFLNTENAERDIRRETAKCILLRSDASALLLGDPRGFLGSGLLSNWLMGAQLPMRRKKWLMGVLGTVAVLVGPLVVRG